MHLKYVLFGLLVSLMAILTGCSSTQTEQTNMVEEYYLKPTSGEDAARIDAIEQEIVAINNRKEALLKEDHIIDLKIRVAEEDLAYEVAKGKLLLANFNLAVGLDDEALVNQAKADIATNEQEIQRKECVLELLKLQKGNCWDEVDLRDAELNSRLAEWDYLRAKIARVNQDKHLNAIQDGVGGDAERINVDYFERIMIDSRGRVEDARRKFENSSSDVKREAENCGSVTGKRRSDSSSVRSGSNYRSGDSGRYKETTVSSSQKTGSTSGNRVQQTQSRDTDTAPRVQAEDSKSKSSSSSSSNVRSSGSSSGRSNQSVNKQGNVDCF